MSVPLNQTSRDLVFCHSCENEWYRDEHGLECPECHSDVVEIIEAEHDPRQEMHQDDEIPQSFPFMNILGGIGRGPTEDGSETGRGGPGQPIVTHEERDTPDGHHVSRTIRFTSTGGGPFPGGGGSGGGGRQQGPSGGDQTVQNLFQSLFSQVGGMTPEQVMRGQATQTSGGPTMTPQSPQGPNLETPSSPASYDRGPPPDPYTRGPPPPPDGAPQIRTQQYRWGPFNVSMTTSSNTFVNGRPVAPGGMDGGMGVAGDEDMDGILSRAFEPLRGHMRPAPGNGGFIFNSSTGGTRAPEGLTGLAGPLAMILSSLGMAGQGGRMGDLVFSDEAMDQIVSRLMEQNQQGNAPGPATSEAIDGLPQIKVTQEMLGEGATSADCAICLVPVELGEEVAQLPCKHWFHFGCVKAWLTEHDTCPQCRRGITPREGDGNRPRETGEAPRHWQAPSPSLTRSNTIDDERGGTDSAPGTAGSDSQAYGSSQDNASRWRSRSPSRTTGGSGAQSFRESVTAGVRNAMRSGNGILGWVGRPRTGDDARNQSGSSGAQQSSGLAGQTASTSSTTPNGPSSTGATAGSTTSQTINTSRPTGNREHDDLDVPDVD